jgi:uncharacterized Ntn-hydrolase superfamily protein
MTWSILARDPETGFIAMAVASKFFAVGGLVPWSHGSKGAAMSQALPNPEWGIRALDLLGQGHSPDTAVTMQTQADPFAAQRQLHVMDPSGASAAWTGPECIDWAGHVTGPDVSVAGNMLAGPDVVGDTMQCWLDRTDLDVVSRLLAAMEAGEGAGGDKRGRQSAALRIQGPEAYPRLDLRADDHADPLAELARLYAVARDYYLPFSAGMPRRERPWGIGDRQVIDATIARDGGRPFSNAEPAT